MFGIERIRGVTNKLQDTSEQLKKQSQKQLLKLKEQLEDRHDLQTYGQDSPMLELRRQERRNRHGVQLAHGANTIPANEPQPIPPLSNNNPYALPPSGSTDTTYAFKRADPTDPLLETMVNAGQGRVRKKLDPSDLRYLIPNAKPDQPVIDAKDTDNESTQANLYATPDGTTRVSIGPQDAAPTTDTFTRAHTDIFTTKVPERVDSNRKGRFSRTANKGTTQAESTKPEPKRKKSHKRWLAAAIIAIGGAIAAENAGKIMSEPSTQQATSVRFPALPETQSKLPSVNVGGYNIRLERNDLTVPTTQTTQQAIHLAQEQGYQPDTTDFLATSVANPMAWDRTYGDSDAGYTSNYASLKGMVEGVEAQRVLTNPAFQKDVTSFLGKPLVLPNGKFSPFYPPAVESFHYLEQEYPQIQNDLATMTAAARILNPRPDVIEGKPGDANHGDKVAIGSNTPRVIFFIPENKTG